MSCCGPSWTRQYQPAGWWWSAAGPPPARPAPPMRRSRTGWRTGSWTTRWTPARWRRGWRPGSRPARCCGWVSCASTPTPTAARRCWAAWPTCSKVRATWSSPPCGPSSGTPTLAAARAGPGAADPAGTAGRLLERLPELTGRDPARDRSGPRRGHRRPGPVHRRRPGRRGPHRRPAAGAKRPRRPRAPGRTGRSPSTWPGSPTCWTAMPGPAATPTARRSSPRRWTPPGSATPARCPPRSSRRPRSGT